LKQSREIKMKTNSRNIKYNFIGMEQPQLWQLLWTLSNEALDPRAN